MEYAIKLKADGRIAYCTYPQYAPAHLLESGEMVLMAALPEGDYNDYRYVDGQYVYDPLPRPEPAPPQPSAEERLAAAEAAIIELAGMVGGAK